jgi:hypothetical protein
LTAQTWSPPLNLFKTKVANASPSISSETIINYLLFWLAYSKNLRIDWTLLIFLSARRINGFLNSHFDDFVSVTKYGEIYPLSHLIPSTYSTSVSSVFPS